MLVNDEINHALHCYVSMVSLKFPYVDEGKASKEGNEALG